MKHRLTIAAFVASLPLAVACGIQTTDDLNTTTRKVDPQIVADFADKVVVPTYEMLATRAETLASAVDAAYAAPTTESLAAAREAWRAAREPWELSEGFLFGPVDTQGLDPALDSWPVNQTDLDAVLGGSQAFTDDFMRDLDDTLKGFHTIEYLLFGAGGDKAIAQFTAREWDYLQAATANFEANAVSLAKSWTEGAPPFRDTFAGAGGNTVYPSVDAAIGEMLNGMSGICDEVANGKVADPFDNRDVTLVESRFARNSLEDFTNNLRSVKNVYYGDVPQAGTQGKGLDEYVAEIDPLLDQKMKAAIAAAIAGLEAIPAPFEDAILDADAAGKIKDAQAKIRALFEVIENELRPALQ